MADTAINAAPRVLTAGSVIRISDGATDYAPAFPVEGSVRVTWGMRDKLQVNNRVELPAPILGKKNTSRVSLKFRAAQFDATGLHKILSTQVKATPDQYVREFDIEIDLPDYDGAATGDRLTLSSCAVVPGTLTYEEGSGDYDMIAVELDSRTEAPAWASY